ncbi:hypothetical protein DPMN_001088 [Dreissena polymorpha]|uniref:Uncharacterized protein n=1 Tax=Dreissena polymorpha TaxID=45954 RepID=A0A9D4MKU5_DREPO|nr:hypothetical protein DPMN_001088 [Dreissena polymorpha]
MGLKPYAASELQTSQPNPSLVSGYGVLLQDQEMLFDFIEDMVALNQTGQMCRLLWSYASCIRH